MGSGLSEGVKLPLSICPTSTDAFHFEEHLKSNHRTRHMNTAQLMTTENTTRSYGDQSREDSRRLIIPKSVVQQSLSDCHSAEHLLVGTHHPGGPAGTTPICLTCKHAGVNAA